jgi:hypothetical protein
MKDKGWAILGVAIMFGGTMLMYAFAPEYLAKIWYETAAQSHQNGGAALFAIVGAILFGSGVIGMILKSGYIAATFKSHNELTEWDDAEE